MGVMGLLENGEAPRAAVSELLTRGVEEVFVRASLEKKLASGKPLRVKLGIDPTSREIHLGRAVALRKLKAFQDLGHQIIFVVGDFTARVGDPSDKLEKRPMLSKEAIEENLSDYTKQVELVFGSAGMKRIEIRRNSAWLSKLRFDEIAELAESFSVQQMSSRRNFKERLERGGEVSLREFLYPLMQGYDSVAVRADVEIGGFDQLFNLMAGRIVQKHYGLPEQDILTTAMLPGTDGRKMSSSWGNVIALTDLPGDMFGKVMAVRDDLVEAYFTLCTDATPEDLARVRDALAGGGTNPRDIKLDLAEKIVGLYRGAAAARKARENFIRIFSRKEAPITEDLTPTPVPEGRLLAEALIENGLVPSRAAFRRLIDAGAVSDARTGEKITDPRFAIRKEGDGQVFRIGKHRLFYPIVSEK